MPKPTHKCPHCNGQNVAIARWTYPNTGDVGEDYLDSDYQQPGYCEDCNQSIEPTTAKELVLA